MYKIHQLKNNSLIHLTKSRNSFSNNLYIPTITKFSYKYISDSSIKNKIKTKLKSKLVELHDTANSTFIKFFPTHLPSHIYPNFINVQFFTNHGNFKKYKFKIKATNDPQCPCGTGEQDSLHLLLDCPLFTESRPISITEQRLDVVINNVNSCIHVLNSFFKSIYEYTSNLIM